MNLGSIFTEILTAAKSEEQSLLPLVGTAVTSVIANPTEAGAINAGVQLLLSALGTAEPAVIQGLATAINAGISDLVTKATAAAAKKG